MVDVIRAMYIMTKKYANVTHWGRILFEITCSFLSACDSKNFLTENIQF